MPRTKVNKQSCLEMLHYVFYHYNYILFIPDFLGRAQTKPKKMPGHVAKTVGPDPSPDQWLYVSDELKVKLKAKPYDPKKSCWVPEKGTGGYLEGLIESVDGGKVSVKLNESKEVS